MLETFKQQITNVRGLVFFPICFTTFVSILFCNILGLLPYGYTLTGHIMQTFSLGFSLFLGILILGFVSVKVDFLRIFVPTDVPQALLFFLVYIELMSYIIRPFSLSVRLFANMLAGHTLLAIVSSFTVYIGASKIWFLIIIPFAFLGFIFLLEVGIAFIQSYVFLMLLCIYLNDVFKF